MVGMTSSLPKHTLLIVCEIGRGWTFPELRHKSWEDIHSLWWKCCKERNRLATERAERERMKIGKGDKGEKQARLRDMEVGFAIFHYMSNELAS